MHRKKHLLFLVLATIFLSSIFIQVRGQSQLYTASHKAFYVHTLEMYYDYVWCISILSMSDKNHVSIYELTKDGGTLVKEVNLDSQEVFKFNGSENRRKYFKIISTDPISVSYYGGQINAPLDWNLGWGQGSTFYGSKDGSFVGKEFLFTPLPNGRTLIGDKIVDQSVPVVFALEDCEITLEGPYGPIDEWFMYANSSRDLNPIEAGAVYRLISTGKVMLATFNNHSITSVPSLSGNFIGRKFVTRPALQNQTGELFFGGIVVYAYEDCEVTIRRLESGIILKTLEMKKGNFEFLHDLPLVDIHVSSTGNIGLWSASSRGAARLLNLGDDVTFIAGKDEMRFYVPSYAVIFAPQTTEFKLDGSTVTIEKDRYMETGAGYHIIETNKPLVVEIVALTQTTGQGSGPNSFGTTVITVETAVAEAPAQTVSGLDLTSIIAAVIVAVVAVVAFWRIRGRRKTQ